MATRYTPYLTIDILFHAVVKKKFPLRSLAWYLFEVVSGNRYVTRGMEMLLVLLLVMYLLPDRYHIW